jgi:hypothetical protein
MAKKHYKAPLHQTGTVITTKTAYGSTSDMITDHTKYKITINDSQVLCKDDKGFYITSKSRIDTGLADPNRYANLSARFSSLEEVENASST